MSLCNPAVGMVYCSYKEARMTAQQIALDWHHAIQAHDARQFGIGLDAVAENSLGDDKDARPGRALRIHARRVPDGFSDPLTRKLGHPLCRCARGNPPGREQQDFASAPRLAQ